MNKQNTYLKFCTAVIVAGALSFFIALPASAQTAGRMGSSTGAKAAKEEARLARLHDRGQQELDRRIAALTALSTRLGTMKHLSDANKSALINTVAAQITTLSDLKTKLAADTDLTLVLADVQSITKSYRIFALVIPQGHITAAADRVIDIAGAMSDTVAKLQTRITDAGGGDAGLASSLADLNAKLADAKTQAQAAIAEVAPLVPDNGDKTIMAANTQALKDARMKVKAAVADLKAARADAKKIVATIKILKKKGTASSTVSN